MGVRDWGLDRLDLALRAHRHSSLADELELIVVDYGSTNAAAVAATAEQWDAKVCRVDTRGRWNRSRSLNVGVRASKAPRVLTTDADIIFGPRTIETLLNAAAAENDFFLVQCHDLPPLEHEELECLDFEHFAAVAALRPPWGMGGCACFPRQLAFEIRGFDERMEWWGSEDNDFVQRAMQHGENVRWFDDPDARCYHIWHPKATEIHAKDDRFQAAVKRNKRLVAEDPTTIRNAFPWGTAAPRRPTITAAIVTRNRAHLIGDAIDSLLVQTWADFEILIVDDGSTDATEDVVKSYDDSRIRYLRIEQAGIPVARNLAVREARGDYICIVDDDDIQLPDRIERHLSAVEEGYIGSFGGWIDFDEETGDVSHHPGRPFSLEALLFSSKVLLHPAACVLRDVLLANRYDPSLPFGSDFDLALRIAAAGYKLKHVGSYSILRRVHHEAVTNVFGNLQRRNGVRSFQRLAAALRTDEVGQARKVAAESKPLKLTDPLADRSVLLRLPPSIARFLSSASNAGTTESFHSWAGGQRLLERPQQRPARLELGPFGSVKQCEVNVRRLENQAGVPLAIEPRKQGAADLVHFIVWPWSTDGSAWTAADWIERAYRYPCQIVIEESPPLLAEQRNGQAGRLVRAHSPNVSRRSLQAIATEVLPENASALVISRGDDALLQLGSAVGSHFPQGADGHYAGYHPADGSDAVAQLDALRNRGAEFLVIPATSLWWLEHYDGFRRHLESHCRLIHFEEGACLIYALHPSGQEESTGLTKPLSLSISCSQRNAGATA